MLVVIYRTLRIKLMLPHEQWTEDTTYTGITSDFHLTSKFLDEEQVSLHTERQRGKMGGKKKSLEQGMLAPTFMTCNLGHSRNLM